MVKVYTDYNFLSINRVLGLPSAPKQLDEAPSIAYVLSLLSNPTVIGKTGDYAPVQTQSTSQLALSGTIAADASGAHQLTIGGIPIVDGRVLLAAQTNPAENGLYTVAINQATGAYTLTRATDADQASELIAGNKVLALGGATGGSYSVLTTSVTTLGTSPIIFVQSTPINPVGTETVQKFAANLIGDGTTRQFPIVHNLKTLDVSISVKIPSIPGVPAVGATPAIAAIPGEYVNVDILDAIKNNIPDINSTIISFAHPPAIGDTFRVIAIG